MQYLEEPCAQSDGSRTSGGSINPLSAPDLAYDTSHFELEEAFPVAITSYASRSRGGKGQEDMWAVANLCRKAGITTYNCMQAGAQENWKEWWFGKQPEAKLALVFLDEAYFESEGCVEELMAIISTRQPFVPINFGVTFPFLKSDFLSKVYGSDATKMKLKQHTIRQFLGNIFAWVGAGL